LEYLLENIKNYFYDLINSKNYFIEYKKQTIIYSELESIFEKSEKKTIAMLFPEILTTGNKEIDH